MDPQPTFCPILECPSSGLENAGNLRPHDSLKNRWRCLHCGKTFTGTKGTPFYRLKTDKKTVMCVLSLLAGGCPMQAIVATFGLDERTVSHWQKLGGDHCQKVHEEIVQQPQELTLVQADEIRVKIQGLIVWLAMAICPQSRLWLGAEVSKHRDKNLARNIANKIKSCCKQGVLVVTDGWPAYKDAFRKAFREAVETGKRGRPELVALPGFALVQTVKWVVSGYVIGIKVCHCAGNMSVIKKCLSNNQLASTAYMERLNATFRQRLAGLCRRSRCLFRTEKALTSGVYLVGTVYNFCTAHSSLRTKTEYRTPAMAAGLTTHIWSVGELLCYHIAPPPYEMPKKRGRKPKKSEAEPGGTTK